MQVKNISGLKEEIMKEKSVWFPLFGHGKPAGEIQIKTEFILEDSFSVGSTAFEGGDSKKSSLPIASILCCMGLTVGAGCGLYHHVPEMLTFMGAASTPDVAGGAFDGTAAAATKVAGAEGGCCGGSSAFEGMIKSNVTGLPEGVADRLAVAGIDPNQLSP